MSETTQKHDAATGWIVRRPDGTWAWVTSVTSETVAKVYAEILSNKKWSDLEAEGYDCVEFIARVVEKTGEAS